MKGLDELARGDLRITDKISKHMVNDERRLRH